MASNKDKINAAQLSAQLTVDRLMRPEVLDILVREEADTVMGHGWYNHLPQSGKDEWRQDMKRRLLLACLEVSKLDGVHHHGR